MAVNGDVIDEENETFFVQLSGASNAEIGNAIGRALIIDDYADGDGYSNLQEFIARTDPTDPLIAPVTVYEDAEDATTDGWEIYDDRPYRCCNQQCI